MNSSFGVYVLGLFLMVVIYGLAKLILKGRREVTYHFVERVIVFGLAFVLLLVAVFLD